MSLHGIDAALPPTSRDRLVRARQEHFFRQVHSDDTDSAFREVLAYLAGTTTEAENELSDSNALDEGIENLAI
jgi:hypothetical protein